MKNAQKIILSFIFVLSTAFITHYFFVQRIDAKATGADRDLASFAERNSAPQIRWEQKIADELSESASTQAAVTKPSWHDLLVYEYLSGQYDIVVKQGQIEALRLQPSMTGVQFKTTEFIEKYVHKMKKFATYKIQTSDQNNQNIELFDLSGSTAGHIQIQRNDDGLVQNILIQ